MSDKSSNAEMISLLSEIRDLLEAQKTEKVKVDVNLWLKS